MIDPAPSGRRAFVALGANLGDAAQAFELACQRLGSLPQTRLCARSSLYRSAPIDAAGPDYLNAVAELETGLGASALLSQLQRIESALGRVRSHRNAPRTIDLDLLALGDEVRRDDQLTVPHPRLHERAFVLLPLLELAPDLALPGLGRLAPYLRRVADQALERIPGSAPVRAPDSATTPATPMNAADSASAGPAP